MTKQELLDKDIIYFEINNWMPGRDYPDAEPFLSWMQCNKQNNYYIIFRDKEWVEKNKLVVVESIIDMSCNYCITATKEWVMSNCPELLTKYTEFLRPCEEELKYIEKEEDFEVPEGQFGCPFLEYTEENIGHHLAVEGEDSQGYNYYRLEK